MSSKPQTDLRDDDKPVEFRFRLTPNTHRKLKRIATFREHPEGVVVNDAIKALYEAMFGKNVP